jgi:non-specific serine/threonine protein kinase
MVELPDSGAPRVSMLETIREFAVEQLVASGEDGPYRRHAEYFAALAAKAEPAYWGDAPGTWRDALEPEEGNLEAAHVWATDHGETDLALRLTGAWFDRHLGSFYRFTTATDALAYRQRVRLALAMPGGSPASRVRALTTAVWLTGSHEDHVEARALATEALTLARTHDDQVGVAGACLALGSATFHGGDAAGARTPLTEALAGFRALGLRGHAALTLTFLAALDVRDAIDEGGSAEDLGHAAALAEEALAIFRAVDPPHGITRALHLLAYIAFKQRDLPRALTLTQEVLARDWTRRWPVFAYLEDIADIAGRTGQAEVAARLYGAAEALRERAGKPIQPLYRAEFERDAAFARRALGEERFAELWAQGRRQAEEDVVAEALALTTVSPSRRRPLTAREIQVVRLLAAGRSGSEIATTLFLSPRTVQNHVAHLLAKLGVSTRSEAVAVARELGLIDGDEPTDNQAPR